MEAIPLIIGGLVVLALFILFLKVMRLAIKATLWASICGLIGFFVAGLMGLSIGALIGLLIALIKN